MYTLTKSMLGLIKIVKINEIDVNGKHQWRSPKTSIPLKSLSWFSALDHNLGQFPGLDSHTHFSENRVKTRVTTRF